MSMRNLRKKIRNGQMRAAALLPAWCLTMGALTAGTAHADGVAPLPISFQIQDHPIQKVPTTFKFQARVSQGKIPTGDGVFDLNIHLKSAGKDLCSESLKQVRVVDSVLNVEIGRSMNCQLDEVMATYADLSFQICIQNDENCLKPIAMSTVPYAVKASYAAQAQVAHQSDVAAQCNYAHRIAADDDLTLLKDIGSGYYDFHTPTGADTVMIDGQSVQGGFIQWTPVASTNKLNVCAKTAATGELHKLAEFAVHADVARMVNQLQVGGALHVGGAATFDKSVGIAGTLHAADAATFDKTISVAGAAQVQQGLVVSGTSGFLKGSTTNFDGDVIFTGKVTLPAGSVVAGNSVDSSAVVDGSLQSVDIADGSLQSIDIADGSIATVDLADGSVTNPKLGNTAVDSRVVLNESLTTDDIKNFTILGVDLAANSLNGGHIVDGTIFGADVAASTLTGSHIQDNTIAGADITDGTIGTADIATKSINADRISFATTGPFTTGSGWTRMDTNINIDSYKACVLIAMMTMDTTGSCNIIQDTAANQRRWYIWGRNSQCNYLCF
jgi:hypothetical protein